MELHDRTSSARIKCYLFTSPKDFSDLEATYKRLGREIPKIKFKDQANRIICVEESQPVPIPLEK